MDPEGFCAKGKRNIKFIHLFKAYSYFFFLSLCMASFFRTNSVSSSSSSNNKLKEEIHIQDVNQDIDNWEIPKYTDIPFRSVLLQIRFASTMSLFFLGKSINYIEYHPSVTSSKRLQTHNYKTSHKLYTSN